MSSGGHQESPFRGVAAHLGLRRAMRRPNRGRERKRGPRAECVQGRARPWWPSFRRRRGGSRSPAPRSERRRATTGVTMTTGEPPAGRGPGTIPLASPDPNRFGEGERRRACPPRARRELPARVREAPARWLAAGPTHIASLQDWNPAQHYPELVLLNVEGSTSRTQPRRLDKRAGLAEISALAG